MVVGRKIEVKKDDTELVNTNAENNAKANVLTNSLNHEKNVETDVAKDTEKGKIALLGANSIDNGITDTDATNFEKSVDKTDTKKSWTNKAGDWVREHKNLVGRGAGIGASVLVFSLFKRRRKKKEEKETKAGKEPGFLKRTRRSLLGIGATLGGGYAAYKIAMGMIDGSKSPNERVTDDYKEYKEKDPQGAEKYEKLGSTTDTLYESIFQKELDGGWQDDGDMKEVAERANGGKEALQGVVPYMMDDKYSSVNDMLSYHGEYMSVLNDSIENISSRLQGLVTGSFGFLKNKFFGLFMKSGDDKKMSFIDWINKDSKKHAQELKFFVREGVRIQTFILEKEQHLLEKIAQQKLFLSGGYDDVHAAMKDSEWMNKNVYTDSRYIAFRSGKLKGAFEILDKEGLLNADLTQDTKDIIKDLDADRDEIIGSTGDTNNLEKIKKDLADDGKIEESTKKDLYRISQSIVKDMNNELLDAMQTTCLSPFADLLNMDDAAKRDFMEKTGMVKCFNDIKTGFAEFSTKMASGELSASQIESFIHTVNTYTAWKKEVFIGATTVQQVKANKDGIIDRSVAVGGTWLNLLKNTYKGIQGMYNGNFSLNNFGYLFFGGISIYAAGGLLYLVNPKLGKGVQILGKYTAIAGSFPVSIPYKILTNRHTPKIYKGVYRGPAGAVRKLYFDGPNGATKLWSEFEAGKIRLKDAEGIIKSGKNSLFDKIKEPWNKEFSHSDNIGRRLIEKKWGANLMTNGQLDLIKAQIIADYYDIGNVKEKLRSNFVSTLVDLEKIETAKNGLTGAKLELFQKIKLEKSLDIAKLEEMIQKIKGLDESLLQGKNIETIANTLVKNPDAWKDATSLELAVKKINAGKAAPVTPNISPSITRTPTEQIKVEGLKKNFETRLNNIESALKKRMSFESEILLKQDQQALRNLVNAIDTLDTKTITLLDDIIKVKGGGRSITCIASLYQEGVQVEKVFLDVEKMMKTGSTLENSMKLALQSNMEKKLFTDLARTKELDKYIAGLVDASKADAKILKSLSILAKEGAVLEKIFKGIAKIKI